MLLLVAEVISKTCKELKMNLFPPLREETLKITCNQKLRRGELLVGEHIRACNLHKLLVDEHIRYRNLHFEVECFEQDLQASLHVHVILANLGRKFS